MFIFIFWCNNVFIFHSIRSNKFNSLYFILLFFSFFLLLSLKINDSKGKMTVQEMRKKEENYFINHSHFSSLPTGLFGVQNLSKKLTILLVRPDRYFIFFRILYFHFFVYFILFHNATYFYFFNSFHFFIYSITFLLLLDVKKHRCLLYAILLLWLFFSNFFVLVFFFTLLLPVMCSCYFFIPIALIILLSHAKRFYIF